MSSELLRPNLQIRAAFAGCLLFRPVPSRDSHSKDLGTLSKSAHLFLAVALLPSYSQG